MIWVSQGVQQGPSEFDPLKPELLDERRSPIEWNPIQVIHDQDARAGQLMVGARHRDRVTASRGGDAGQVAGFDGEVQFLDEGAGEALC